MIKKFCIHICLTGHVRTFHFVNVKEGNIPTITYFQKVLVAGGWCTTALYIERLERENDVIRR